VIEVLKQSGCPRAQHLLGFDAWFKQLDLNKKGKLEMGSMTGLALKVARFDVSKGKTRHSQSQQVRSKSLKNNSSQVTYLSIKAVDSLWPNFCIDGTN